MVPPGTYQIQKAIDEQVLGQGPPKPLLPPAPDEWIRRLGTLPLLDQPGERWMYHTGSDVLGVLIARASGRPLETFLRERIFEPLGMKDTGFSVPEAKIDRLATCAPGYIICGASRHFTTKSRRVRLADPPRCPRSPRRESIFPPGWLNRATR